MPAKRELISPHGDKRYVRRDTAGRFTESDDGDARYPGISVPRRSTRPSQARETAATGSGRRVRSAREPR